MMKILFLREWLQMKKLLFVHDPKYIEIVKKASKGKLTAEQGKLMELEQKIHPSFQICMKQAQSCWWNLTAVDYVMEGKS